LFDCATMIAAGVALASLDFSVSRAVARVNDAAHVEKAGLGAALAALIGVLFWLLRCL